MRMLTPKEMQKCVGLSVVFIGNDYMPANVGKISSINDNKESFIIKLNNDKCAYEIPYNQVMCWKGEEFKEWILESVYDEIASQFGLPPVSEMILADYKQRQTQKQEKTKMAEEKKAAKAAKQAEKAAKEAAKQQRAEEKKAKEEAKPMFQLVVCKKDPATKKAVYTRADAKNEKVVTAAIKELFADPAVTSVQILVRK